MAPETSTALTERLRAIVATERAGRPPPAGSQPPIPGRQSAVPESVTIERTLGGEWHSREGLSCLVVERRLGPQAACGREPLQSVSDRFSEASSEARLLAGGALAGPPFMFFDLETTGLNGGAGTYAFLVGLGAFDEGGGFVTRQFVLTRPGDERHLLTMVGAELAGAGALVSFNGKSFDAPLLETRYLYHRLPWAGDCLPHVDVLHPARRFWGDDDDDGRSRCSLVELEARILGARRTGDVPGSEIPARYYHFVRTGDAQPLVSVLEHNRRDLLSLAGLAARLLDLVLKGSEGTWSAREALALGRIYARSALHDRAVAAYEHAMATGAASIRVDAARALACLCRRSGEHDRAAAFWRALVEMPACPPHMAREASEALAVHHEHRIGDLRAARAFALRSLAGAAEQRDRRATAWNQAVRHRLDRIERKMKGPRLEL